MSRLLRNPFMQGGVALATICTSIQPVSALDCANEDCHASQRACLERVAAETDARVGRLELRLAAKISHWDQDAIYISEQRQMFEREKRAYRAYRESTCEFDARAAAGGNGAGDMRLQCRIDLDRARQALLKERLDWFRPAD